MNMSYCRFENTMNDIMRQNDEIDNYDDMQDYIENSSISIYLKEDIIDCMESIEDDDCEITDKSIKDYITNSDPSEYEVNAILKFSKYL